MNDELRDSALGRALGAYSRSLRQVQPSAALDARLVASIQEHAGVRQVRPLWRRPMPWVVAAASVTVVATGIALLLVRTAPPASAPSAQAITRSDEPAVPAIDQLERSAQAIGRSDEPSTSAINESGAPAAQAIEKSGAPPGAPVGAAAARNDTGDRLAIPSGQYSLWPTEAAVFRVKASLGSAAQSVPGERQYWVDVRVANDGSMRIVRVLPANPEE
jgi:hypothetical protein